MSKYEKGVVITVLLQKISDYSYEFYTFYYSTVERFVKNCKSLVYRSSERKYCLYLRKVNSIEYQFQKNVLLETTSNKQLSRYEFFNNRIKMKFLLIIKIINWMEKIFLCISINGVVDEIGGTLSFVQEALYLLSLVKFRDIASNHCQYHQEIC